MRYITNTTRHWFEVWGHSWGLISGKVVMLQEEGSTTSASETIESSELRKRLEVPHHCQGLTVHPSMFNAWRKMT